MLQVPFHYETGFLLGVSSFLHVSEAILLVFVLRNIYQHTLIPQKQSNSIRTRLSYLKEKEK